MAVNVIAILYSLKKIDVATNSQKARRQPAKKFIFLRRKKAVKRQEAALLGRKQRHE